ncbi:Ribosomal RNA small subunit methyltransferase G [bacterium HR30]|nr:Ribosomal RNA small subunit methyltransferase G [bacterium HR30]
MPDLREIETAIAELARYCTGAGFPLSPQAQARLRSYTALLLTWNQRISLTGARDASEIALHHIFDSLHILPLLKAGQAVADVGSGAGFPGVPLAIAQPNCSFVLIEPRRKRANFLRHCARELDLPQVIIEEARVEELYKKWDRSFDVIVSRAFAELATFVRLSLPLLKESGTLVAMKGPRPESELASIPAEVTVAAIHRYRLPQKWGERTLVVLARRAHSCFT